MNKQETNIKDYIVDKNNTKYWVYYLILQNISTADFGKYVIINKILVTGAKILISHHSEN